MISFNITSDGHIYHTCLLPFLTFAYYWGQMIMIVIVVLYIIVLQKYYLKWWWLLYDTWAFVSNVNTHIYKANTDYVFSPLVQVHRMLRGHQDQIFHPDLPWGRVVLLPYHQHPQWGRTKLVGLVQAAVITNTTVSFTTESNISWLRSLTSGFSITIFRNLTS